MSWRTVVITKRAKLDLKMNHLVVRQVDSSVKIHLGEIAILIIESTAVSLTTALLSALNQRKIKVIFCDEKRNPSAELIPYYGSFDVSLKIDMQYQWSVETKAKVWTRIVEEKIRNQSRVLLKNKKIEHNMLEQYIQELELGDTTNREGHAAKVYFNALFGNDFSRSRDNRINAALNYGYTIILSTINREISASGYLTQKGIFHRSNTNPFNLSSDLIEPWRTIIDTYVVDNIPSKFETEEKTEIVNLLNKTVSIDNKNQTILNALGIYCRSVFDALNNDDPSLIRFYGNEL